MCLFPLAVAKNAELEAAAASGQTSVKYLLSDGTTLEIPMGTEMVVNPLNNQVYKVGLW